MCLLARVRSDGMYCRTGRFSPVFLRHAGAFCFELRRGIRVPFAKRLFIDLWRVGIYLSLSDGVRALSLAEWRAQQRNRKE